MVERSPKANMRKLRFCECPIRTRVIWRENPNRCWRCRGRITNSPLVEPEVFPCPGCGSEITSYMGNNSFWCGTCLLTYQMPGGDFREVEIVRVRDELI